MRNIFRLNKIDKTNSSARENGQEDGSHSQRREASPSNMEPVIQKDKNERKKKQKHGDDIDGSLVGSSNNETRGGAVSSSGTAVPSGAQNSSSSKTVGLSVNDFISKTKKQHTQQGLKPSGPELIAYARYLGIDPVADHDLLWIAVEALEAPLPSEWTEHFDSNDRVFYYNATMRVSSWTHPLEHKYRETYKTIVTFRNANMSAQDRQEKIQELREEVRQMEKEVHREISQWTEHEDEHKNRFYFNKEERQSTWTDPRPAKCQILYLRKKMVGLLDSSGGTAGISTLTGRTLQEHKGDIGSRFAPLAGVTNELEDPAHKRPKVGGRATEGNGDLLENTQDSSPPASFCGSDSEDGDHKKKKKKHKKEKKSRKEANHPPDERNVAPPPRLGSNMRNSQSEPIVGGKPMLSNMDDHRGGLGGLQASSSALSTYDVHNSDALSTTGRARPKAGIRLEPISGQLPPTVTMGSRELGTPNGVRNSASVPAL